MEDSAGTRQPAEMALRGSPSVTFDAVAVLAGLAGDKALSANPYAVGFLVCRQLQAKFRESGTRRKGAMPWVLLA